MLKEDKETIIAAALLILEYCDSHACGECVLKSSHGTACLINIEFPDYEYGLELEAYRRSLDD